MEMTKSDHQMNLLSQATKDGQVLYPGLRKTCECIRYLEQKEHDWLGCRPCSACMDEGKHSGECIFGSNSDFHPNPDPLALIAAAQEQGWDVNILSDGGVSLKVEKGMYGYRNYDGPDWVAALIDALFQATTAEKQENWGECPSCISAEMGGDEICLPCVGTGIVLKEAQE